MNGMRPHNHKASGFTLLEVIVAITIMGIVAAIVIPQLRKSPVSTRMVALSAINTMTNMAHSNAMMTGVIHRVSFDIKRRIIEIEKSTGTRGVDGNLIFKTVDIPYAKTTVDFPRYFEIQRFFVAGRDQLARYDIEVTAVWFYLVPEGLAQEVRIDAIDLETDSRFSLVLNPFTARFALE